VYQDTSKTEHQDLYILTPGAFIIHHQPISIPEQDYPNLYPIQILLRSGTNVKHKILMIYFNLKD